VPFVVVNPPADIGHLENGRLSDIAPTLLDILHLTKPAAMTGHSLISSSTGRQAAD
jgi:2,3-bisphosphoglycerate-independent phosphoglycerate mutase